MQRVNMGDHLGFTGPACLALQYPLCRLITDPSDGLRQIQPPVTRVVFEQFCIAPPVNGRRQLPLASSCGKCSSRRSRKKSTCIIPSRFSRPA
jgi:hypothetical protein